VTIFSVDPGKEGAFAVLDGPKILALATMPLVKGQGTKDVIDLGAVRQLVVNWAKDFGVPSIFVIEKQSPRPATVVRADEKPCAQCGRVGVSTGSLANWSRGYGQAMLEMLAVCLGLRYALVAPQTWQADILRDTTAKTTKQAALVVAKRLWPGQSWLATARSRKPHDGIVDAVCLGEYARRRFS
jgi:hypothetical protein